MGILILFQITIFDIISYVKKVRFDISTTDIHVITAIEICKFIMWKFIPYIKKCDFRSPSNFSMK